MKTKKINSGGIKFSGSRKNLLLILLVFLILKPGIIHSQQYYVNISAEAGGDGSQESPFRSIHEGIKVAQPGDTVFIFPGAYDEELVTLKSGLPDKPIVLISFYSATPPAGAAPGWVSVEEEKRVWIKRNGRGIDIVHSYIVIDGINVDGLWHSNSYIDNEGIFRDSTSTSTYPSGTNGIVRINSGVTGAVLKNIEVKNNPLHLVRIHGNNTLVDNARIHYGICRTVNSSAPQPETVTGDDHFRDAHGIEASDAKGLTITNTYIGYVSGDCVQSGRSVWNKLTVENCHFEIKPIDESILGLQPGTWFSEDIYDTKTPNNGQGGAAFNKNVIFRNNILNGTRYSRILHGAVLNLKEGVEDILVEGNRVFDNRMTFRLRQPTIGYTFRNNFIYNNETVFRFEGPVADVKILNNTFYNNEIIVREIDGGATGSVISKNIFADGPHLTTLRAPHIVWDFNLFHEVSSPQGTNRVEEDPLFNDADIGDFTMLPTSPALTQGLGARPWYEPFFTVWLDETNAPVFEGQVLELSVNVVNFGGVTGRQAIELRNNENHLISSFENLTLESGESLIVDFTWDIAKKAGEEFEVFVRSENDLYKLASEILITGIQGINEFTMEITLGQNYPNPFRVNTKIGFGLPKKNEVLLEIYSLDGHIVAKLVNELKNAGWYEVTWNASHMTSGVYLVKLQSGNRVVTRTLIKK